MSHTKTTGQGRGFTLIELLVVMAILGLLTALLLPALRQAQQVAWRAACRANLHHLGTAIHLYADYFDDLIPFGPGIGDRGHSYRFLSS